MIKKILFSIIRIILVPCIIVAAGYVYIAQPTPDHNSPSQAVVSEQKLRAHVEVLSEKFYPRNYLEQENLNKTAAYIQKHFKDAGAEVEIQEFDVSGRTYKNIIGFFGKGRPGKLIVGAHYDASDDSPGADDNASGVAGLIELAYLLGRHGTEREVELVAYCLEEPPFFSSSQMGSAVHAARIKEQKQRVDGVIVFEMIGYFSEQSGSQEYPMPLLRIMYPGRGNFIVVVGLLSQRQFTKTFKAGMKGTTDLPVFSINAPRSLPGVDLSDHRNYWDIGLNAVMITDTAFYRNTEYHKVSDTAEKLDYAKMAKVVVAVFEAMKTI